MAAGANTPTTRMGLLVVLELVAWLDLTHRCELRFVRFECRCKKHCNTQIVLGYCDNLLGGQQTGGCDMVFTSHNPRFGELSFSTVCVSYVFHSKESTDESIDTSRLRHDPTNTSTPAQAHNC